MNYYAELGLKPGAIQDEVKAAFRKLAHIHHPDKGGDVEKFKRISCAYSELMKTAPKERQVLRPDKMKMHPNLADHLAAYMAQQQMRQEAINRIINSRGEEQKKWIRKYLGLE